MLRYLTLIFWCSVAALLTAVFAGEDLTVSLRIWLAAFVGWFASWQLVRTFSTARVVPSKFSLLATYSSPQDDAPRALHDFRNLESLLLRSRDNERTHRQQLRPRLAALADHFLLVHHGISRSAQPEQAAALLGDVAWLLDDAAAKDAPTLDEVDRLLDRILPTSVKGTS